MYCRAFIGKQNREVSSNRKYNGKPSTCFYEHILDVIPVHRNEVWQILLFEDYDVITRKRRDESAEAESEVWYRKCNQP